ncbi:MAG: domain containing protein [Planctomycetaceae bacterium]|nr:domain containing protein [Planctomycetaceae bacterium]
MNGWLAILLGSGSLLGFLFVSMACWTLRGLSRSRLEHVCKQREPRLHDILARHDQVQLRLEYLMSVLGPLAFVGFWTALGHDAGGVNTSEDGQTFYVVRISTFLLRGVWCLAGFLFTYAAAWAWSRVSGERLLANSWPVLSCVSVLAIPAELFANQLDKLLHGVSGVPYQQENEAETLADELRSVTEEGHRDGVIEAEARTMIRRVIDFSEVDVADIMTPRTEMVCINQDASLLDARQLLLEEGHSRVPVIGASNDDVKGILHAKDLLRYLDGSMGKAVSLADIAREPFYVPKTMGVQKLLESFKQERAHLAIVLDEYGGVAGLVTMEDILEELVGEIVDEFDAADDGQPFRDVVPGATDISAKAHIDDVNERLNIELPSDGHVDTLGGLIFSHLGRIPVTGEQFEIGNVHITVLEAHKRRIVRLRLKIHEAADGGQS